MQVFTFLILPLLLFVEFANAGEALYFGIRRQFEGTRAQGMGGAFVGVADDNTAIFYNPAGLRQLKEGESNWFLKLDADEEIWDLYKDIEDATENTPPGQTEEDALANLLQANYGNHYSLRLPSLGWLWARPTWGLAVILSDLSIDMGLHRTVGPSINLVAINDTTVAFSKNWEIDKMKYGKMTVGVTAKTIYRLETNKVVSIAELSNDNEVFKPEDAREGLTVDADVGIMWISPWEKWQLNGGLVVRNILDYGYITELGLFGDESGTPDNLGRAIDIGGALKMPGWWVFTNKLALDFRDMLHPNASLMKSLHLGYEANWQMAKWWRGGWRVGLNQGYWTAGFTGEFVVFKLDIATYGEEVGSGSTKIENRRWMVTMSLDF